MEWSRAGSSVRWACNYGIPRNCLEGVAVIATPGALSPFRVVRPGYTQPPGHRLNNGYTQHPWHRLGCYVLTRNCGYVMVRKTDRGRPGVALISARFPILDSVCAWQGERSVHPVTYPYQVLPTTPERGGGWSRIPRTGEEVLFVLGICLGIQGWLEAIECPDFTGL